MIESFTTPTAQPAPVEFTDDIDWGEEELEAPACDLSNPDICESCQ
jgi:hypothetical protein